jgi:hypothetical protein
MRLRSFPPIVFTPDREKFLVNLCRDKVVLHLGCADSTSFDEHIRIGRNLHAMINGVSRKSYGVDIDKQALEKLKKHYKISNIFEGNVEDLKLDFNEKFDVIICGEIIEHLNNPGLFLNGVKAYMESNTILVLTTPNVLSLKLLVYSLMNKQRIHYDHSMGFTFSLLETLLYRHNYHVDRWVTSVERFSSQRNLFGNWLFSGIFSMLPRYADTLIALVRYGSVHTNEQSCFSHDRERL